MANPKHIAMALNGKSVWNAAVSRSQIPEEADFTDYTFEGDFSFSGFNFPYGVNFSNSIFKGNVSFDDASFSNHAFFPDVRFERNASFDKTSWSRPSNFDRATFCQGASFNEASFQREHSFVSTIFGEQPNLSFQAGDFSLHLLMNTISFKGANFFKVDFSNSVFNVNTSFEDCLSVEQIILKRCTFVEDVRFTNARFNSAAHFEHSVFSGAVDFSSTEMESRRINHPINFKGCFFGKTSVFKNRTFENQADFSQCIFSIAPDFYGAELHQHTIFPDVTCFTDRGPQSEASYRALKLAMNKHHAHSEEMMFFGLEMKARRFKEPWPGKILYWAYEGLSDYGQSVLLPILGLVSIFFAALVFYMAAVVGAGQFNFQDASLWTDAGKAFALTIGLTIPVVLPALGDLKDIISSAGLNTSFLTICFMSLHVLFSITLLFLLGLGLRNRFRLRV